MFPTLHLAIGPRAGKRDGRRSEKDGGYHEEQNAIANEVAGHRTKSKCELRRVLKRDLMFKAVAPNQHHCASNTNGEDGSNECVQTCPFQVGETETLLRDTTLLKEELP